MIELFDRNQRSSIFLDLSRASEMLRFWRSQKPKTVIKCTVNEMRSGPGVPNGEALMTPHGDGSPFTSQRDEGNPFLVPGLSAGLVKPCLVIFRLRIKSDV